MKNEIKKMQFKTINGNDVVVDVEKKQVTVAQGTFPYEGPNIDIVKKERVWALTVDLNGQPTSVALCEEDGRKVFNAQERLEEDRLEKLFPGLRLLKAAHDWEEAYQEAVNRMMEDEQNDGVRPPKRPEYNMDELSNQFPLAAAYIKAEAYVGASNFRKADAGLNAKKCLEEGGSEADANAILSSWCGDGWD